MYKYVVENYKKSCYHVYIKVATWVLSIILGVSAARATTWVLSNTTAESNWVLSNTIIVACFSINSSSSNNLDTLASTTAIWMLNNTAATTIWVLQQQH